MRASILFLVLFGLALPAIGQERDSLRGAPVPPLAATAPLPLGSAMLRARIAGSIEEYDLRAMGLVTQRDPEPDWNTPAFRPRSRTDLETQLPPDYGVARLTCGTGMPVASDLPFALKILSILGGQAMNFGYQYLRETARGTQPGGLDELHLPGAPGVYRTSDDVRMEALRRGEVDNLDIAIERREQERKKAEQGSGKK